MANTHRRGCDEACQPSECFDPVKITEYSHIQTTTSLAGGERMIGQTIGDGIAARFRLQHPAR
jgi:hypothetical protein